MNHFKAITVNIYQTPEIFQSVFAFPTEIEPGVLEVDIRMPLYITPSCISTDVRTALDENGFKDYSLAALKPGNHYKLAPKEFTA